MKHLMMLAWLLPTFSQLLTAQDSLPQKRPALSATTTTLHGHRSTGYLYAMSGSALLISGTKVPVALYDTANKGMQRFDYKDLEKAKIYKKGQVGRSMLGGLLIGGTIGALIGLASGDDSKEEFFAMTAGEKALGAGLLGGTAGVITGLIIGLAAHKTFIIRGKKRTMKG